MLAALWGGSRWRLVNYWFYRLCAFFVYKEPALAKECWHYEYNVTLTLISCKIGPYSPLQPLSSTIMHFMILEIFSEFFHSGSIGCLERLKSRLFFIAINVTYIFPCTPIIMNPTGITIANQSFQASSICNITSDNRKYDSCFISPRHTFYVIVNYIAN